MLRPHYRKAGSHLLIWLTYITFAVFVFGYDSNIRDFIVETVLSVGISAIVFYSHAFFLLPFFDKRRYGRYVLLVAGSYLLNFILRYAVAFYIYPLLSGMPPSVAGYSVVKLLLIFSWQWLPFIIFSTAYWLAGKRRKSEEERKKLQFENDLLRARIDPHFLFNTFNSLKVDTEMVLPEVAAGISAVMHILRASISRSGPDGMVPLEQEIKVIDSLILIYRRRFPEMELVYEKQIDDDPEPFYIMPHILVVFVENLFKHGSKRKHKENYIRLSLKEGSLSLVVHNQKGNRAPTPASFRIGTDYIKHILDTSYQDRHKLQILETDDHYRIELNVHNLTQRSRTYELYHH